MTTHTTLHTHAGRDAIILSCRRLSMRPQGARTTLVPQLHLQLRPADRFELLGLFALPRQHFFQSL